MAYLASDNQDDLGTTIRKALAAILAGRDPTALDQTNAQLAGALPTTGAVRAVAPRTGEDVAPVPTKPGTPYVPLVSRGAASETRSPNGSYEPSFTGGAMPNMLAQALANGGMTSVPINSPSIGLATAIKNAGSQVAGPGATTPPSDEAIPVPGFKGAWTRAAAAASDPEDTSTPDAEDWDAAKKAQVGRVAVVAPSVAAQPAAGETQSSVPLPTSRPDVTSEPSAATAPSGRSAALAAAIRGNAPPGLPPAPPGTHYASGPGAPLLIRDDQDALTAGGQGGFGNALARALSGQSPSAPAPMSPQAGFGMAGPAGAVAGAPGFSPGASGTSIAGSASNLNGGASAVPAETPQQAEIRLVHDDLRAQEDQAKQRLASATTVDTAKLYAEQLQQLRSQALQFNNKYIDTLKEQGHGMTAAEADARGIAQSDRSQYQVSSSGEASLVPRPPGKTQILSDNQLTQAERDAGGEWTIDTATGKREQVSGTEGDSTRAPNADESARLVAAGRNPKDYQVSDGKLEVIPSAKPDSRSFGQIGEDQYGNKQYGFTDKTTGEVTPYKAAGSPALAGGAPGIGDATVDSETTPTGQPVPKLPQDQLAKISTLDPAVQGHVAAILAGRETMPKIPAGGRINPITQMITQGVFAVNPQFDAANNQTQVNTRKAYSPSGNNNSPGVLIQNGDAALDHLSTLLDASRNMPNYGSLGGGTVSEISNLTGGRWGGNYSAAEGDLNSKAQIAAAEAIKYLAGATGGGEAERDRLMNLFSSATPPEKRETAVRGLAQDILEKKIELQAGWRRSMGPNTPDFEVVSPNSIGSIQKLGFSNYLPKLGGTAATVAMSQGSAAPAGVQSTGAQTPAPVRANPFNRSVGGSAAPVQSRVRVYNPSTGNLE